jgi:hypothetical protein
VILSVDLDGFDFEFEREYMATEKKVDNRCAVGIRGDCYTTDWPGLLYLSIFYSQQKCCTTLITNRIRSIVKTLAKELVRQNSDYTME